MTTQSRTEIIWTLREFVQGRLSSGDLAACVARARVSSLSELLEAVRLNHADFDAIAFSETNLRRRIETYLDGTIGFWEFSAWALQLYRIFSSVEYRQSRSYSTRVDRALMLLALIVDVELSESIGNSHRLCRRLADILRRGHRVPSESILKQLLSNKRELRFVSTPITARTEPGDEFSPTAADEWVDVALVTTPPGPTPLEASLDLPFEDGSDADNARRTTDSISSASELGGIESGSATDDQQAPEDGSGSWFIPIAVCTRRFFAENRPDGPWYHPENDKMLELRERYPERELFPHLKPHYYVDPDGLVEVVLDHEEIGAFETEAAVRLFCLRNGAKRCYLDDSPLFSAKEES